jgi:hypothetical protein
MPEAITDEYGDEAKAATRKLRKFLIRPNRVHVAPWRDEIYATDEFTCLRLTGNPAVDGLAEGVYKATPASGLVRTGDASLDVGRFVTAIESNAVWCQVTATRWSVAESVTKAMLVYFDYERLGRVPLLVNESTWTAFRDEYGYAVKLDANAGRQLHPIFRARLGTSVIGYVAGIEMPEDELDRAYAVVRAGLVQP